MTARPDEPHVGLVVEGPGDAAAVPLLLRRWLHEEKGEYRDILGKSIPLKSRDKALSPNGIEGYVATAASRPGCRAVLVLIDGEGDAVCELGPRLLERARSVTTVPVVVVLADPKYEAWLVASAETMDIDGLDPDSERDPGGQIADKLAVKYVKPVWQPRLTARLTFALARSRSQSLSRLFEKLDEMTALI
jgi:hypothetical protein